MNCLMNLSEGGQASVAGGRYLGMEAAILKNSWSRIYCSVNLFSGSKIKIYESKLFACFETLMCSGKEYWLFLIL